MTNPTQRHEPLALVGDIEEGAALARIAGKHPPKRRETAAFRLVFLIIVAAGACGEVTSDPTAPADPTSTALAELAVSRGQLEPSFNPEVFDYTLTLNLGASDLVVSAVAEDPEATVSVAGGSATVALALGDNHVDVVVSGPDGERRVYTIFVRRGPGIGEQASLESPTGEAFGVSVAISGDTLAVGASGENDGVGVAYVFTRSGDRWTEQARLAPSGAPAGAEFGHRVALDRETLVVGARFDSSTANNAGAAYVFVRDDDEWVEQARLESSNLAAGDELGTDVAISGDTIVVGAPREDTTAASSGAAYVFVRSAAAWTEQAMLKASNPDPSDVFGTYVALDGDTVAVGVPLEDSAATGVGGDQSDNSATTAGAAYIFVRTGTSWSQEAYLKGDGDPGDRFGDSIAISGDTLAVGSSSDDAAGLDAGAVHVFGRSDGSWTEQERFTAANIRAGDRFGKRVDVDGDIIAVGALFADGELGSAYVFTRAGDQWSEQAHLQPSNGLPGDRFGRVAVDADTVVVGSTHANNDAGSAHVFQ